MEFLITSVRIVNTYRGYIKELKSRGFSETDAFAYAFAYVLGAFDTGVKLLKKDGNRFKELHTVTEPFGTGTIFRASDCIN